MSEPSGPVSESASEEADADLPILLPEPEVAPASESIAPDGVLYKVDSSRASFAELWRDAKPSTVWALWISKLLRTRAPGSVNDPNVESLLPFQTKFSAFPPDVKSRMKGAVQNLATFGFDLKHPICHAIVDRFNNSRMYIVTLPRADGQAVGRVIMRSEGSVTRPKIHFYRDFITELSNGEFLWSTSAKATLDAPRGVHVERHLAAAAPVLWEAHQKSLAQMPVTAARGSTTFEGARAMLERHHALLRDFHLRRKLFQPLSDADRNLADALNVTYARASAFPEVVAEVERLQHRTSSRLGAAAVLVISLLLFLLLGTGGKSGWTAGPKARELLLILVPVLFFHELGHYVAMRVFHYRNVRMFFIPMFGAAVSGTNYTAPGWKKVIVSLMGPLPGIFLGAILGAVGIVLHNPLIIRIALVSLILNGANLIPVIPLDGGRVVQTLLFSRHYVADVIFRACAGGVLIWAGMKLPEYVLLYVGIVMLVGIPLIVRRGQIVAQLRREGVKPPPSTDQRIPPEIADAIIVKLKAAVQKVKLNNRSLAQSTLAIYEALCNRPPGWLATIGFGALHVSAIVLAAVIAIALFAEQRGGIANLLRSAANAPRRSIALSDIETTGDHDPSGARHTLIANFASTSQAKAAYSDLRPTVHAGEAIERFGQTLLIAFPATDDAARRRHVADIEPRTKTFVVCGNNFGTGMLRLTCRAPSESSASAIREEVEDYVRVPKALHLVPPWSPTENQPLLDWDRCKLARSTYLRLERAGRGTASDPTRKAIFTAMQQALQRGDSDEYKRLAAEQAALTRKYRKEEIERIKNSNDASVDPAIVSAYLSSLASPTTRTADGEIDRMGDFASPAYQEMAQRMGQLPLVNGQPTAESLRFSTQFGDVHADGVTLKLEYWSFDDPIEGTRALVNWLTSRGCKSMRYDFLIEDRPTGLED